MKRVNSIIAFLLFLSIFAIYSIGVSPSVYGGDSGDVILAAWFGGVAHPPGYPLNTMLGWVFTHLPYSTNVAFKADIMAVFLQALVICFLYLILQKITKNTYVSIVSALVLAFNPLFWLYAHILEVFQLNLILVSISIYFLITWRESVLAKKVQVKVLYFSIFFLGLAVFHHHTAALLGPAYFYLIFSTKRKVLKNTKSVVKLGFIFLLGLFPYIFVPFAAMRQTPVNWDNPVNVSNFIRLITRGDYGTFIAAGFIIGSGLMQKFAQLANLFLFIRSDFTIIGLILIVIGAVYSFLRFRQLFWFVAIAFFMVGPFFLIYASFPIPNNFYTGLWERFILISYLFATIYLSFGLMFMFDFSIKLIKSISKRFSTTVLIPFSIFVILLTFPIFLIRNNYSKSDLSNFHLGDWLGQDILSSAEDNSIIFILGDTTSFNTEYIYYTYPKKKNVRLIRGGALYFKEYREQVIREFPDIIVPNDFISLKADGSDTYMVSLMELNEEKFGIYTFLDFTPKIEGFKWTNSGLLKKLVREKGNDPNQTVTRNERIFSQFMYKNPDADTGFEQYMSGHIKELYATVYADFSDELYSGGFYQDSVKYLNSAITLSPDLKDPYIKLGDTYFRLGLCEQSRYNFEKAFAKDKKDWRVLGALARVYGECFKDQARSEDYQKRAEDLKNKLQGNPL